VAHARRPFVPIAGEAEHRRATGIATAPVLLSLRSGGGRVDATGAWLVGAKGEYPLHRPYLPSLKQWEPKFVL
jgi:hypothetical protein